MSQDTPTPREPQPIQREVVTQQPATVHYTQPAPQRQSDVTKLLLVFIFLLLLVSAAIIFFNYGKSPRNQE